MGPDGFAILAGMIAFFLFMLFTHYCEERNKNSNKSSYTPPPKPLTKEELKEQKNNYRLYIRRATYDEKILRKLHKIKKNWYGIIGYGSKRYNNYYSIDNKAKQERESWSLTIDLQGCKERYDKLISDAGTTNNQILLDAIVDQAKKHLRVIRDYRFSALFSPGLVDEIIKIRTAEYPDGYRTHCTAKSNRDRKTKTHIIQKSDLLVPPEEFNYVLDIDGGVTFIRLRKLRNAFLGFYLAMFDVVYLVHNRPGQYNFKKINKMIKAYNTYRENFHKDRCVPWPQIDEEWPNKNPFSPEYPGYTRYALDYAFDPGYSRCSKRNMELNCKTKDASLDVATFFSNTLRYFHTLPPPLPLPFLTEETIKQSYEQLINSDSIVFRYDCSDSYFP